MATDTGHGALDAVYREVFERGVRYCLPAARLTRGGAALPAEPRLTVAARDDTIEATWLGSIYRLDYEARPFTPNEIKLLGGIGRVLSARYRTLRESAVAAEGLDLFRGLPEDRFVSAYLDPTPYVRGESLTIDRIAEAIEVLRISSSSTYENRRIDTGVLLVGAASDPAHAPPPAPDGALAYSVALTATRSFYPLSDGMRTVALVDGAGRFVGLVDVGEWAGPFAGLPLPAPCAAGFEAHCRATLQGGHVCLVLTRNGEIKAFADGAQAFTFIDGRWRLSDPAEKYARWVRAVDRPALAERLFTTALNMAERRRGGLFVVLRNPAAADRLVPLPDRLDMPPRPPMTARSKDQFHYLFRGTSILDLTPTVVESLARIDGAIVMDREASLLAFGSILRHDPDAVLEPYAAEGGRTTAAIVASRDGEVLKVSEDGLVTFFSHGRAVWEL